MTVKVYSLLFWLMVAFSQASFAPPSFDDFPVQQTFKGNPAPPVLTGDQKMFRTIIRAGAKSSVEFAGHYTVPRFGCGAGCVSFYIADSISGRVYDGFSVSELPDQRRQMHGRSSAQPIEFRPSSRLFKIAGCPNEKDCGLYDYVMIDGSGLRLANKQLLPEKSQ